MSRNWQTIFQKGTSGLSKDAIDQLSGIEVDLATALAGGQSAVLTTKGDLLSYSTIATRLPVGTNGQVLTADSTQTSGVKWADSTATGGRSIASFGFVGPVAVTTGTSRWLLPATATILGVVAAVGTAPTGASLICDVNKNGTTIFTTQANRPTIAISANATTTMPTPDVTALASGDYLTVDVDQIGSTVAGSDLVVNVYLSVS